MCPLESAKIDSDWPSRLRSSRVSRTVHGSHVKWSCSITSFSQQLGEVFDHDVRAMSVQSVGLAGAVDAHHEPKATGPAGLDTGQCVLVDGGLTGFYLQEARGHEVGVGGGLAREVLALGDDAIDLGVEGLVEPGGGQDLGRMTAGGDDGELQAGRLGGEEVADRAVVGLNAVVLDEVEEEVVFLGGDLVDGAVGDCDVA